MIKEATIFIIVYWKTSIEQLLCLGSQLFRRPQASRKLRQGYNILGLWHPDEPCYSCQFPLTSGTLMIISWIKVSSCAVLVTVLSSQCYEWPSEAAGQDNCSRKTGVFLFFGKNYSGIVLFCTDQWVYCDCRWAVIFTSWQCEAQQCEHLINMLSVYRCPLIWIAALLSVRLKCLRITMPMALLIFESC